MFFALNSKTMAQLGQTVKTKSTKPISAEIQMAEKTFNGLNKILSSENIKKCYSQQSDFYILTNYCKNFLKESKQAIHLLNLSIAAYTTNLSNEYYHIIEKPMTRENADQISSLAHNNSRIQNDFTSILRALDSINAVSLNDDGSTRDSISFTDSKTFTRLTILEIKKLTRDLKNYYFSGVDLKIQESKNRTLYDVITERLNQ